jgi:predicted  nucleic acid-binding Zn-ribbon protein
MINVNIFDVSDIAALIERFINERVEGLDDELTGLREELEQSEDDRAELRARVKELEKELKDATESVN